MNRHLAWCLLGLFVLPARGAETLAELTAQVRGAEVAFAKTLADRDLKAFTAMIAPDVIWIADKPLRGPEEVLTRWRKYFAGPTAPFSWSPEHVEVQEGGKLALSTGPVTGADGKPAGTFTSIWRREATGEWKIIFDSGSPACDCAGQKP